MKQIRTDV